MNDHNSLIHVSKPTILSYILTTILWLLVLALQILMLFYSAKEINKNDAHVFIWIFTISIGLAFDLLIPFIFLSAFNSIISSIRLNKKIINQKQMVSKITLTNEDRVCVIHMTCNAFEPSCLLQTMNQTYKNVDYIICDDSSKEEYITQISDFCKKYSVKLFRRTAEQKKSLPRRSGNWYEFIHSKMCANYDYVVFTDEYSCLDVNVVENSLKLFKYCKNEKLAYVQCRNCTLRSDTWFSKNFTNQWDEMYDGSWKINSDIIPIYNGGYGVMYDCKILKTVPLNEVSLANCDDFATSAYLLKNGFHGIFNIISMCCKKRPTNICEYKKQQIKWNYDNKLYVKKYSLISFKKNSGVPMYVKTYLFMHYLLYLSLFPFTILMIVGCFILPFILNISPTIILVTVIWSLLSIVVALFISLFAYMFGRVNFFKLIYKYFILLLVVNTYQYDLVKVWVTSFLFNFKQRNIPTIKKDYKITFKIFMKVNWFSLLINTIFFVFYIIVFSIFPDKYQYSIVPFISFKKSYEFLCFFTPILNIVAIVALTLLSNIKPKKKYIKNKFIDFKENSFVKL